MIICNPVDKCTGCGLCLNSCPKNAISFKKDKEGFLYPEINPKLCVKCNKCINICPQNQKEPFATKSKRIIYYYANAIERKTRNSGSSGGIFGVIAKNLLKSGYVIYGAAFDNNLHLSHMRAENEKELKRLYCSKYIQSDISNIHKNVLQDIKNGTKVLFVGTPCQVDAIKRFVGDTQLMITIDLVCYGVGSNSFFDDYLQSQEQKYRAKATDVIFRKKIYGNHNGFTTIKFKNSKKYKRIFCQTEFGIAFCNYLINRPSCYDCKYSSLNRTGDLTIGDYRPSSNKRINPFQLKKGVSLIKVNTTIGEELINLLLETKKVKVTEVDYEKIKDKLVRYSPKIISREKRDKAMEIYTENGYNVFVDNYCLMNKKTYFEMQISYLKEIVKWIIRK